MDKVDDEKREAKLKEDDFVTAKKLEEDDLVENFEASSAEVIAAEYGSLQDTGMNAVNNLLDSASV